MKGTSTLGRLLLLCCLAASPVLAQGTAQLFAARPTCPGDPPGNLASADCAFHARLRLEKFVTSSLTDQAMLGATFFGLMAQFQNSPADWNRSWTGFGYRVGTRYAQGVAKGLTEYAFDALLQDDPRHVSYASDPLIQNHKTGVTPRIGHAFMDWLTVRKSRADGKGRRLPNLSLFAGAAASGFVGYAWYPDRLATPGQAGIRASYSIGTALASSFYTEFQPEVGRLLGTIFKRRAPANP